MSLCWLAGACRSDDPIASSAPPAGTRADREALFDEIVEKTTMREAWSPLKNASLSFDPLAEMRGLAEEVAGADTEPDLFRALVKLSNARRDRHLSVTLVDGGLRVPFDDSRIQAPIRFLPDYATDRAHAFFVSDIARGWDARVTPGDRLTGVNGRSIEDYVEALIPYTRHSLIPNLRWTLARRMSARAIEVPPDLQGGDTVRYELERGDGTGYVVDAPWLAEGTIDWIGHDEREYAGFEPIRTFESFDVHRDAERRVLTLDWHRFGGDLIEAIDWLVDHADSRGLLEYDLIIDATRSRGGSLGA
ncbi:MAG: hypothetical protein MJB57_17605, partial [Gemmatimonadetes bacterium]|nr:hypothetical protein [Gemmatimonadota bacterium]